MKLRLRDTAGSWLLAVGVFDQIMVAAVLTWIWRFDLDPVNRSVFAALLMVPLWTYLHRYFGLYDSHRLEGWRSVVASTLTASTVGFLLAAGLLALTGLWNRVVGMAQFTAIWIGLVMASRAALYTALHMMRRRGADRRSACIIGSWQKAVELAEQFRDRPEWGMHVSIVGIGAAPDRKFFRFPEMDSGGAVPEPCESAFLSRKLEEVLRDQVVDEILIAAHPRDIGEEEEAVQLCKKYGLQCRVCVLGDDMAPTHVEYIPGHLAWTVHDTGASTFKLTIKRVVDVVLSAILLLVLSPVFLVLAILVRLSSPGPVFYRQVRAGLRGRDFVLLKYRTMIVDADSMLHLVAHRNIVGGPIFKDSRDWRVTSLGRVLRRFSLDELPQLINVFRGEMSLVGPRPLPLRESAAIEGESRRRFNMRPGITCRWQVQGRSEIGFAEWMRLDVEYVDNWTLPEDLKLLLLTIPAVVTGKGAY